MKKLKLQALELGASEVLTRKQLRNVLGGDGSGNGSGSGASFCAADTVICHTDVNGYEYHCFTIGEGAEEECCCTHDAGNMNCEYF